MGAGTIYTHHVGGEGVTTGLPGEGGQAEQGGGGLAPPSNPKRPGRPEQ